MTLLKTFIATCAIIFGLYGIASYTEADARPTDQEYLADLAASGFNVENPQGIVLYGKWICNGIQLGAPIYPLRDLVATQQQIAPARAETVIGIAVKWYCPEVVPGPIKRQYT